MDGRHADQPISEIPKKVRSSGFGPVLNYDSRDSTFFPHRGTFLDVNSIFASKSLGGDYDSQIYRGLTTPILGLQKP